MNAGESDRAQLNRNAIALAKTDIFLKKFLIDIKCKYKILHVSQVIVLCFI